LPGGGRHENLLARGGAGYDQGFQRQLLGMARRDRGEYQALLQGAQSLAIGDTGLIPRGAAQEVRGSGRQGYAHRNPVRRHVTAHSQDDRIGDDFPWVEDVLVPLDRELKHRVR
jgi:hypothetical protein